MTKQIYDDLIVSGTVSVDGLASNDLDAKSAVPLVIGASIATEVQIGAANITTTVKGDVVSLGETTSTVTAQDNLRVMGQTTIGTTSTSLLVTEPGQIQVKNTNNATSSTSGSIKTLGGIGVGKDLWVEENLTVKGDIIQNNTSGDLRWENTMSTQNIVIGNSTTGRDFANVAVLRNIAIGNSVMQDLAMTTAAIHNVGIGESSSGSITSGSFNTCVGSNSGSQLEANVNNVCIGYNANVSTGLDNSISIGANSSCDLANQCTIGSGVTIIRPGSNNTCDLGESDRGFKDFYLGGTIVGGNIHTRYTWATSNITAGLSDKVMPLFTAGGSSVNFAPFNSTLTKIYFQMDNESDEFSNWSAGDLSYTLYINETSTAVTDTFTFANKATDWSTDGASIALSEYAFNINSGLSLSVAADDRLMIKFSTTAGWSATGGEISLTAVIEPRI